jgi:hypothetical protein
MRAGEPKNPGPERLDPRIVALAMATQFLFRGSLVFLWPGSLARDGRESVKQNPGQWPASVI